MEKPKVHYITKDGNGEKNSVIVPVYYKRDYDNWLEWVMSPLLEVAEQYKTYEIWNIPILTVWKAIQQTLERYHG